MSNENDISQESWEEPEEEDYNEAETRLRQQQRSTRDTFNDPSAPRNQRSRQAGGSRPSGKDRSDGYERRPGRRPGPYSRRNYDAYGRPRQSTSSHHDSYEYSHELHREQPRQTRDFHERTDPYNESDERYRQQHRMSRNSREAAEARQRQRRRQSEYYQDEENDVYVYPQRSNRYYVEPEVEEFESRTFRPRPRSQTTQPPVRRQRRVWSTLLIGCAGGLITIALVLTAVAFLFFRNAPISIGGIGKTTFTKQLPQQTLPIASNVTQLQIHNRVGNISIIVDPTAKQGSVNGVMKVQARNSSDADKEFGRIKVDVTPNSEQSALIVNSTIPNSSGGLLAGSSDTIDLAIVLPASVNTIPPFKLSADIAAAGDISVQNFNGLLTLTNNTGSIGVKGGLMNEGSCLQTHIGSITFAGSLTTGAAADTGLIPCTTNTTNNSHPWFSFKSGTGNINVMLSSATTSLTLDASTNNGKINSGTFGLTIQQSSDGSASYYGPLTQGTTPTALLALTVSTGNITLQKAA